jgi:GGDEF domain-containing protein
MRMNRSTTIFIAFFAITMYLFAIAFFTFKMISYSQQGRENIIVQCTDLTQKAFDFIEEFDGINDNFMQGFIAVLDMFPNIALVLVETEHNGFFSYPKNTSFLSQDDNSKNILKTQSPLISVYSSSLLHNNEPITLTFALYHVSPYLIHDLAKKSFFILFLTTLFVFLTIIINKILQKNNRTESDSFPTSEIAFQDSQNSNFYDDFQKNDFDLNFDFDYKTDTDVFLHDDPIDPISDSEFALDIEKNDSIATAPLEMQLKPDTLTDRENKKQYTKFQIRGKTISDPLGLFSEKTGFGWESYLEPRLDSELIRASSSEQDLALVLIKIAGIEHYPAYTEFISKVLLEAFKFRDLIFEYGQDGFACIYQDLNVEKALTLAEELYIALDEILKNCDVKIAIGISTRSLRIIPGTRILKEAQQAIDKALTEKEDPIIAFKANPDKYKDYVYNTL